MFPIKYPSWYDLNQWASFVQRKPSIWRSSGIYWKMYGIVWGNEFLWQWQLAPKWRKHHFFAYTKPVHVFTLCFRWRIRNGSISDLHSIYLGPVWVEPKVYLVVISKGERMKRGISLYKLIVLSVGSAQDSLCSSFRWLYCRTVGLHVEVGTSGVVCLQWFRRLEKWRFVRIVTRKIWRVVYWLRVNGSDIHFGTLKYSAEDFKASFLVC